MSTKSRTSAKGLLLPSVFANSGAIRAVRAKYEGMGKTGNEIRKMWKQIIEEARELTKTVKGKVQSKKVDIKNSGPINDGPINDATNVKSCTCLLFLIV